MRRFILNTSPMHYPYRLGILLLITALLLSSACNISSPPPTPPPPPNQPPTINSLTAENEALTLSESQIICEANDADSDNLTYQWSADGGIIKGEGSSITWVAPDTAGSYTIAVTITDDKGGTVGESTTIAVIDKPNQPPTITSVTKDGNPPDEENRVRQWTTVTLQCNAQDPDGDNLSYLWRSTGGPISGEGSTVGWTSPGVNGDYTVTVVVTDGRGGKTEASIVFKVLCCGGGRI
ncbi:MAG: PKD domain-containing protein [Chloroflexi bacterium]|nr:PKD domain-containing protein [Chloroflexota bacterium]